MCISGVKNWQDHRWKTLNSLIRSIQNGEVWESSYLEFYKKIYIKTGQFQVVIFYDILKILS